LGPQRAGEVHLSDAERQHDRAKFEEIGERESRGEREFESGDPENQENYEIHQN